VIELGAESIGKTADQIRVDQAPVPVGQLQHRRSHSLAFVRHDADLRHQASGGGTVTITSSVVIVNDTTCSTIVGTRRPGRLELYVDGWSRRSSTAAATSTGAVFGI
jgi:hypothetical protein